MAWLAIPVALLGTVLYLAERTPVTYREPPAFTVVFFKLAVLSKNPAEVLAAFHMPGEEFSKDIGHHRYEPMVPKDDSFRQRIVSLVTPVRLAAFYWHYPEVAAAAIQSDRNEAASDVSLNGYGHLREVDVVQKKTSPEFNLWSGLRRALFRPAPLYPVYLFGLALIFCVAGAVSRRLRERLPLWPLPAMATSIAVSCYLTASLMDAVGTRRHLVLVHAATDLTILMLFLAVLARAVPALRLPGTVTR